MVLAPIPAAIGAAVTVALAAGAVLARALTPLGGATAAAFGTVIVVFVGLPFLALLILFVVASTLATRYRFEEKRQQHFQEGARGERGVSNVVAHIVVPTGLAIAAGLGVPELPLPTFAVLYASALAFGAADTLASEIGVLEGRAWSILTFRSVPPGTNGGISGSGEAFAFAGALGTAAVAFGLFTGFGAPFGSVALMVVAPTVAGFLGCQVDSVLGEALENRGYLTKHSTNFLGMLSAVAIATAVLVAAGAVP